MKFPSRSEKTIVQLLTDLLAMENAEAARYDAALPIRSCDADSTELIRLRNEHRRHAAQLKLIIHAWGGRIPHQEGSALWAHGRRALRSLVGERAMLELMKREEQQVTRAYLATLARPLPTRVRQGLEIALREQLLHGGWYEGVLEQRRRARKLGTDGWLAGPTNRAA
jgi:hypothetical protein